MIVEIDGERYDVDANDESAFEITSGAEEVYELRIAGKHHRLRMLDYDPSSRTYTIEWDGQRKKARLLRDLDLLIEKMGLNNTNARKMSIMEAPMPGLVTAVKVKSGDHILKGAPLLILEAMKMENVIAAPHDATIKEIKVNIGQAVERGLPLIEFE